MRARRLLPLFLALASVPVFAGTSGLLVPVLPEVTEHLEEGRAEIGRNGPSARAHAFAVLLAQDVPVSLSFEDVPVARRAGCRDMLESAMREWEIRLDHSIHFHVVEGWKSAVVVHFRPSVTMNGQDVAGYVTWKRTIDRRSNGACDNRFSADLQLRTTNMEGDRMPLRALRHVAMHELGHVLGLDDSDREGDVMGPLDVDLPCASPSAAEITTVRTLRADAREILRRAGSFTKSE